MLPMTELVPNIEGYTQIVLSIEICFGYSIMNLNNYFFFPTLKSVWKPSLKN